MKLRTAILSLSLPTLLVVGTAFALQDKGKPAAGAGAPQGDELGMEMPKPTKEHAWLQTRVGTWDCTVHCPMAGEPTKGTETNKSFGDFSIVSEFEGTMMGMPFKGLSIATFDPIKQKYVTCWCDTMTPSLFVLEGTMDASGKKLTSTGKGPNMEHKIVEYTNVLEMKGPDETLFTMYETSKGANDPNAMRIEYKRRK